MCELCESFGGLWMDTPQGLKPCKCRAPLPDRAKRTPVLSPEQAAYFVEVLAAVPGFPSDAGARAAIGNEIHSMCHGITEAAWLTTRMRRLYNWWPGPLELRRVYASKHFPLDAVRPIGISEFYPEGIPSEREEDPTRLRAPQVRLLDNGMKEEIIEDPKVEATIRRYAAKLPKMPPVSPTGDRFERELREIVTSPQDRDQLPGPTPQIITQEDINRAVAELHARRKADEL